MEQLPTIQVSVFEFCGVPVSGKTLNGIWIDFTVVMLMWVYLNNYSFWIIKKDFKIIKSQRTLDLLNEYWALEANADKRLDTKEIAKQFNIENKMIRFLTALESDVYANFALIMITFLLITSVFSNNFVALGYFAFSMILIINYRNFFTDSRSKDGQVFVLKFFLLPYLLLDILAQLVSQVPQDLSGDVNTDWLSIVGFNQVWEFYPPWIYLGEPVSESISVNPTTSLTILFLKAVVYFVVIIQIDCVQCAPFLKFYDSVLFENLALVNYIGDGLAYRFNNFKIRQLKA